MLTLDEVTRTFRGGDGVRSLSLSISPGEVVALVGLNGAGKTTLMRLALGLLRPDAGSVTIDGFRVGSAPAAIWRTTGHLVEPAFGYPELTVRENLLAAAALRLVTVDVAAAIDEWGLRPYEHRRARSLSSGNRQRLGLAAALQHKPHLVLLDEPTNALDPAGVLILRDALRCLASDGSGILVSSHHLDEVARVADRILVVNAGRLIGELDSTAPDLERVFFETVRADDASLAEPGSLR